MKRVGPPLLLGVIVVCAWSLAATAVGPGILPGPGRVASRLITELGDGLIGYAGSTFAVSVLGSLLGLLVSISLGYLVAQFPFVSAAISPSCAVTQSVLALDLSLTHVVTC